MSVYTEKCHRCGMLLQTHNGEYPSLCVFCSAYMREQKQKRIDRFKQKETQLKEQNNGH